MLHFLCTSLKPFPLFLLRFVTAANPTQSPCASITFRPVHHFFSSPLFIYSCSSLLALHLGPRAGNPTPKRVPGRHEEVHHDSKDVPRHAFILEPSPYPKKEHY